jgi:hypothetical protein
LAHAATVSGANVIIQLLQVFSCIGIIPDLDKRDAKAMLRHLVTIKAASTLYNDTINVIG